MLSILHTIQHLHIISCCALILLIITLYCNRNASAEAHGYNTAMYFVTPRHATPKNDILVGIPKEWQYSDHLVHNNSKQQGKTLEQWLFDSTAAADSEAYT
jgi:hypothetical protein